MSCVDAVPLQEPSRLDALEQVGLPAAVKAHGGLMRASSPHGRTERTGERPISRAQPPANFLVDLRSALIAQRAPHTAAVRPGPGSS